MSAADPPPNWDVGQWTDFLSLIGTEGLFIDDIKIWPQGLIRDILTSNMNFPEPHAQHLSAGLHKFFGLPPDEYQWNDFTVDDTTTSTHYTTTTTTTSPYAGKYGASTAEQEEETRIDPSDGQRYTKESFVAVYGGTKEWDAAAHVTHVEKRLDTTDGQWYTVIQFQKCYGGLKEWNNAKREAPPPSAGNKPNTTTTPTREKTKDMGVAGKRSNIESTEAASVEDDMADVEFTSLASVTAEILEKDGGDMGFLDCLITDGGADLESLCSTTSEDFNFSSPESFYMSSDTVDPTSASSPTSSTSPKDGYEGGGDGTSVEEAEKTIPKPKWICKFGGKCSDFSGGHCSKYSHKERECAACPYVTCTERTAEHYRNFYHKPPPASTASTGKPAGIADWQDCQWGSKCHDLADSHRNKYLHPISAICKHDDKCTNYAPTHRAHVLHTGIDYQPCWYGKTCRIRTVEHHSRRSHIHPLLVCPHGVKCTETEWQHYRDFLHSEKVWSKMRAARKSEITVIEKNKARLGAQSLRGGYTTTFGGAAGDPWAEECFTKMLKREKDMAGEWVSFYHSYSIIHLLYEIQAVLAAATYGLPFHFGPLPRLIGTGFAKVRDAKQLMALFAKVQSGSKDHDPTFRAIAICANMNMFVGVEAKPVDCFVCGYSCGDVDFTAVLKNMLTTCGVAGIEASTVTQYIVSLAQKHHIDCSCFGGSSSPSSSGRTGQMLQIMIKRSVVDKIVYAAKPYGYPDPTRMPISDYSNKPHKCEEQVRILAHPAYFINPRCVRLHCYSADPECHKARLKFRQEMLEYIKPKVNVKSSHLSTIVGVSRDEMRLIAVPEYQARNTRGVGAKSVEGGTITSTTITASADSTKTSTTTTPVSPSAGKGSGSAATKSGATATVSYKSKSGTAPAPSGGKDPICKYFRSPTGCTNGRYCKFKHVLCSDFKSSRGCSNDGSVCVKGAHVVCRDFAKGSCTKGKSCMYAHVKED